MGSVAGEANEVSEEIPALGPFHARVRPAVACPIAIWVLGLAGVGWVVSLCGGKECKTSSLKRGGSATASGSR